MVQNIKQGFYKVIKDEMITNFLFLDEYNVFICSLSISKLVNPKDIKEAIKNIKEHSKYEGEAMFIETVSKNFAANKPIEMHGITNATFSYKEINEGNIRGIISQVVHTRYPLTGKKELFSNSYIIRNNNLLRDYKVLIDDEWYKTRLSKEEFELIQKDLRGEIGFAKDIILENGGIVEIGIIDDIIPV